MPTALGQLCNLLQTCTEELEKETKNSINDCCNRMTTKQMTDVQVALDKAKDYHYKEIINILSEIITNVKKMLFHEEKIKKLNDHENLSDAEIKRYSHVRRQISNFSGNDTTTSEVIRREPKPNNVPVPDNVPTRPLSRREIRRAASEVSVYSLEAWEQYQMQKQQEENTLTSAISLPNININPKLRPQQTKRKHKKFVSSTFNNILEDATKSKSLELLSEDIEEDKDSDDISKMNQQYISKSLELLEEDLPEEEDNKNTDSFYSDITDKNSLYENTSDVDDSTEDETDKEQSNLNSGNSKYSVTELIKCTSEALVDTKPRIVDVVYKKKT